MQCICLHKYLSRLLVSSWMLLVRRKYIYLFSREPAARAPYLSPRFNKREESNQFFFTYCSKFCKESHTFFLFFPFKLCFRVRLKLCICKMTHFHLLDRQQMNWSTVLIDILLYMLLKMIMPNWSSTFQNWIVLSLDQPFTRGETPKV